jgi:hypothetical protein
MSRRATLDANKVTDGDFDIAEPDAASLVESLRAFGYELPTALADLIDNSITAGARNVWLDFHWNGANSVIAVTDDGAGMSETQLVAAMRPGSQNPLQLREPHDLGRFGLGLKTASFSQCRRVTVRSKVLGGKPATRCWNLDHIASVHAWQLLRCGDAAADAHFLRLGKMQQGTTVVWQNMDRLVAGTATENDAAEDAFLQSAEICALHFATVFHRMMIGRNLIRFYLNDQLITPWDPFLEGEPATQTLATDNIQFHGHAIAVTPFVLPHLSKLDAETHRLAAGLRGWNAHQGFYIYRNRRLLVAGDWLGIKGWRQEEHYKLARIRIDLPNALDHEWEIDVTKSRARPPEKLRRDLVRIGERTRSVAKRIYSHRGAKLVPAQGQELVFLWEQTAKHNQVFYRVNRDHPLVKQVRSACADVKKFSALLRLMEETIPVPLITITDRERPDQTIGPFEASKESEILEVMRQVHHSLRASGLSQKDALLRLAHFEPFPRFPQLLQTIAEEGNK